MKKILTVLLGISKVNFPMFQRWTETFNSTVSFYTFLTGLWTPDSTKSNVNYKKIDNASYIQVSLSEDFNHMKNFNHNICKQ